MDYAVKKVDADNATKLPFTPQSGSGNSSEPSETHDAL